MGGLGSIFRGQCGGLPLSHASSAWDFTNLDALLHGSYYVQLCKK